MVNCYFYGRDWTVPACGWRGRWWRWWWWWRSSLDFLLLIQISSESARYLPVLGCQSKTDANKVLGLRRMGRGPMPWLRTPATRDRLKIPLPSQRYFDITTERTSFDKFRVGYRYFYASLFFISHQMLFNASVRHFCRGAARLCFRKLKSIEHLEDLLFLTLNQDYLVLLPLLLLALLVLHPVHQDVF